MRTNHCCFAKGLPVLIYSFLAGIAVAGARLILRPAAQSESPQQKETAKWQGPGHSPL